MVRIDRRNRWQVLLLGAFVLAGAEAVADTFRIEIDFMVETGSEGHSHRPSQAEIDAVQQMFACQGHALVIDISDELPHHDVLQLDPVFPWNFFDYTGTEDSFGSLKEEFFDHAGESGWHYCIFGHQYEGVDYTPSGSSGVAEINGDDLLVSLGAFAGDVGTSFDRAATLAHEFGHNLGLTHCGTLICGDAGPRPLNLPSIMSYFYQLEGVRSQLTCQGLVFERAAQFKEIDYSHGRMCSLDENALTESFGVGFNGVDWNCNGSISGVVSQDLNDDSEGWCGGSGALNQLSDHDEWANIRDATQFLDAEALRNRETISCITFEEWAAYRRAGGCTQPMVRTEACVGDIVYVRANPVPPFTGYCDNQVPSLEAAHEYAREGDLILVRPGTYDETNGLVLNRSIRIVGVGTAIFR